MTEMRPRWGAGHHEHHFPCDCGDWHYLQVSVDEFDPDWRFLEVTDTFTARRWRDRIKAAFTVLRGKTHYHSGVVLDRQNTEDLKAVVDWMLREST